MARTIQWIAVWIAGLSLQGAGQSTPYILTEFPMAMVSPDTLIWIKWSGQARSGYAIPDSGTIYYDRSPGGGNLANYRYRVSANADSNNMFFAGSPPQRGIQFNPVEQEDMNAGVFYYVVAFPMAGDTFYSNELKLIVETNSSVELVGPSDTITELTPAFEWKTNPGVPFYHIILSDEEIKTSDDDGSISLEGLSVVWQAIVPHPTTQIVYGDPDPSGTITASPPPLSPGLTYSWAVLNNYGNHLAYTSTVFSLPKNFVIRGDTLRRPVCLSPIDVTLNSTDNPSISLKWTNLDTNANTYKVYVYMASDIQNVDAQLVVWENEVTAGQFADSIGSVTVDARSVFTSNHYTWRAVAVDDRGAGSVGDTASFDYEAPTGTITVYTKENIVSGSDTITTAVALAEIKLEVLDGSLEAPLAFYTDNNGYLSRSRPTGTYRITAVKDGFKDVSKTITVSDGVTRRDTLFMERVDAVIFGKTVDAQGNGINLATVRGVSERGDTVTALTDNLGSYTLECYESDWTIRAEKTGYRNTASVDTSVTYGQNVQLASFTLLPEPYTLSGTVKNAGSEPLLGVNVKLYRDNVLINEVPSTSQKGTFSFALDAGTYKLTAQKTGFTSYSQSIDVSSSREVTVTLEAGAALIRGYVIGSAWVDGATAYAPITGASLAFIRMNDESPDTFTTVSDATYGDFRLSLPGNATFRIVPSASGYAVPPAFDTLRTIARQTHEFNDTLRALGMVSGTVTMSSDNATIGGVSVTCVRVSDGTVAASGKSQSNGYFEVRGLADDTIRVFAGKTGLVLDSVRPVDTVVISGGRALVHDTVDADELALYMSPGDKTVKWRIEGDGGATASIKLQSPFLTTLSASDSLVEAGPGDYSVIVDAVADSVLDLSSHSFTVADTATRYIDTVSLPVTHEPVDSYTISDDSVTINLVSSAALDSAKLYFKTATAAAYDSVSRASGAKTYAFRVAPPRDGAVMHYYFRAFRGGDIYGYEQEPFRSFIRPNTKLSKLEILPTGGDTLVFASEYDVVFSFKGYYGSTFIPDGSIDTQNVSWEILGSETGGCRLQSDRGLDVMIRTGADSTETPVELRASIVDTSKTKVLGTVKPFVSAFFLVSGGAIDSVYLTRTDANAPGAITSSSGAKAEFRAQGMDTKGTPISITPSEWYTAPDSQIAGTIEKGVFRPKRTFVGNVRIFAKAENLISEYMNGATAGIDVKFVIVSTDEPDTVSDGQGLTIVFPDSAIETGLSGLLSLKEPDMRNQNRRILGDFRTIGSAYEILEENNVTFRDSLVLTLDVPEAYQDKAKDGTGDFYIATWNDSSFSWDTLTNSVVADDGSAVRARILHFSIYSLLARSGELGCHVTVVPNPFSPYVVPLEDIPAAKHRGACITLSPRGAGDDQVEMNLKIYTVLGDLVASVVHKGAKAGKTYQVWWNGKATSGTKVWESDSKPAVIGDGAMCRNGRYFVFVSVQDVYGNGKKYLKNIVLVK